MSTDSTDVALRPLAPADGPAIAELFAQTPDAGQISFTTRFKVDAYTALTALHPDTTGVAAVLPATGQLVGMAMIDWSQRQVEGSVRPCALLNTLKVHPDYRRRGIARRLAEWRIAATRERFGDDVVLLADIQKGNVASERAAQHWSSQFIGQPHTVLMGMRRSPPRLPRGISVRPARPEEFGAIAEQQNRFYQNYNLYAPQTADSFAAWLDHTPLHAPIHHLVVAVDAAGTLLAGAGISERARLLALHVGRLPAAMKLVVRAMGLLPPSGVVDEVLVDQLWFAPGHLAAAQALWAWLRWDLRERGSVLRTAYDPRGPVADVLRLPVWQPRAQSAFAVHAPVPLDPERLIYPYG
jgi:GNAT superfamily N-acetyltransferase